MLLPLLTNVRAAEALFFLDSRIKERVQSLNCPANIVWVEPTIFARLRASWQVARLARPGDVALFFGNLPSIFRMPCKSYVYLQNKLLIDNKSLRDFSLRTRLRLSLERIILSCFKKNADVFLVQTASMERVLRQKFPADCLDIAIFPYAEESVVLLGDGVVKKKKAYDFIYPASGDDHKNHKNLLLAWKILESQGVFPRLLLTLSPVVFDNLIKNTQATTLSEGGVIKNIGFVSKNMLEQYYQQSSALIFPSSVESFGLPLVEAKQHHLGVVAAELDYVRDLIVPDETFDPQSPLSIARAVRRYLGMAPDCTEIYSVDDFFDNLQHSFLG